MVSESVDALIFYYHQGRYAEAADFLRDLECKIIQQSKNIGLILLTPYLVFPDNFLNEILRGELIKNEMTNPHSGADVHRLTLPSTEALSIFDQILSKVELIFSTDARPRETGEQTTENDAYSKGQLSFSETTRLAHLLPDLIITVANLVPEIDFLVTSTVSPPESLASNHGSFRSFLLLERLMISGFEAYPSCTISLAQKLGCAIFFAICHFSEARKSTFEHFRSLLNDVVYHCILRTCSHSSLDVSALEVSDGENELEAAEPDQLASNDSDTTADLKNREDEDQSDLQSHCTSFRDYVPLWIMLLGVSSELNIKKKHCPSSSDVSDPLSTPSALVGDTLLPSVLRILSKLDLSYEVGREAEASELTFSDIVAESLGTGRHSMAIASDDLFVSGLLCLLRLPLSLFSQAALILEAPLPAADLNLPAYRNLAQKLATPVGAAVQLAVLTEHCADLSLVAVEAVESWLGGLVADKEVYRLLYQHLVPELLLLLQSVSTAQIPRTQGLAHANRAEFGAAKLLQSARSGARLRPKAALQRAIRTIGRLRLVAHTSADGQKMPLQKAQARLLQLIGRKIAAFRALVPLHKPDRQLAGPQPLHALSTSDLFQRHFSICLPFPDLRPQLRLGDAQLLSRCFFLLFWRPCNSLNCQSDDRGAVSRQARVSAAEFLHEFIVLGVTNRVNTRADSQLSSPLLVAGAIDGANDSLRFWGLMFHSTFVLAVDTDPIISGLFKRLALQLVHWFAGYPAAGLQEARCLQLVLLSITGLVDETLLSTGEAYDVGAEAFQRQWPLPEQVFLNRIRLAATCMHEFLHWSSKRPSETGILPICLPEKKFFEDGASSSRSNLTSSATTFVELLVQRVIQSNRNNDLFRRIGASLVFSNALFSVLRNEGEILRRYILELIDSFITSASLSEEDESTTEPQRHVCVSLKQVERLLVGLLEQGVHCLPLRPQIEPTPAKRPRMSRVGAASAAVEEEPSPTERCLQPPSWQSMSFFALLDALLRACLRAPSTLSHLLRLTVASPCGPTLPGKVRSLLRSLTENLMASFGQDLEVESKAGAVLRPARRLMEAFLTAHGGGTVYLCSMFDLEDIESHLTVLLAFLDGLSWLLNASLLPVRALQCFLQGSGSPLLQTFNAICEAGPTSLALNGLVQASSCSVFWNAVVNLLAAAFRQSPADAAELFPSNSPVWRCLALVIMQPRALHLNPLGWLTDISGTSQIRRLLSSLPVDIAKRVVYLSRDLLENEGLFRPDSDLSWVNFASFEDEKKALERATQLTQMLAGVTFLIGVLDASVRTVLTNALPDGLCQSLGNKIYELSSGRRSASVPLPFLEIAQAALLLSWSLDKKTFLLSKDDFHDEAVRWIFRVAPLVAGGTQSQQFLQPHLLRFIGLSTAPEVPPFLSLFSKSPRSALELIAELIERLGTSTNRQDTPRSYSILSKLCEELANVWPLKIQQLVSDGSCDPPTKNAVVELLERVMLFAPQELRRSNFVETCLLLLSDQSLKHFQQVKVLDMLAFFLHPLPQSTGLSLSSDERSRLCEAVKLFLAANLPLDLDEFNQSAARSWEFAAVLRSVLSCLEVTACPELMSALTMTFCRHSCHPLDDELASTLRKTMQNKSTKPALQTDLLTGALSDFLTGLSSLQQNAHCPPQHLIITLSVWRRFLTKFLQPLMLYAELSALESFASRHICDLMRVLESPAVDTHPSSLVVWWSALLHRTAVFSLFSGFYNRLPKTSLHGAQAALLRALSGNTAVKGTELTASLIKKAHSCLQDGLTCQTGLIVGETVEGFNRELQRDLWTAALSCLIATVCATQTNEKFYNFVFLPDLLTRLLPKDRDQIIAFTRLRSEKHRSVFLQLPSNFRSADAGSSAAGNTKEFRAAFTPTSSPVSPFLPSRGLVEGSSMALEINRFSRTPGTQIFRPRESTWASKPSTPSSPTAFLQSPPPTSQTADSQPQMLEARVPSAGTLHVELEDDCINSLPLMICLIGLLKQMWLGKIIAAPASDKQNILLTDVPVCIRYFYDQFTSPSAQMNVRSFIVKLVINCPEVFRPFGQLWLAPLLTYLASESTPLLDSSPSAADDNSQRSLSSLAIDLCLLLADWASPSGGSLAPVLPTTPAEREAAADLLAILVRHAWLQDDSTNTYGDASYEQHLNVELFRLLLDCWTSLEITQSLVREVLVHLHSAKNYKQWTFYMDHLREIFLSRVNLTADSFGPTLSDLANAVQKNISQSQKAVLTSAWEVGGLLIARCTATSTNAQNLMSPSCGGECLRSRGVDLVPLSSLPLELQNLALEMWTQVSEMASSFSSSRASSSNRSSPATGALLEAACLAATHWLPLSVHLSNTVLAFCQPASIESSLPRLLALLTRLFQALANDTRGLPNTVDASLKQEILSALLKSTVLQQTTSGSSDVLAAALLLMLRLVQFIFAFVNDAQSDFSPSTAGDYLCQILRTALATLLKFNSTTVSRRLVYRILAEVHRLSDRRLSNQAIKCLCDLGFAFGVAAESDGTLRRMVRGHLSRHHLANSAADGGTAVASSLCRYLSTLGLLSSASSSSDSATREALAALSPEVPSLISALLPNFLTCCLQLFLEPAVRSAEFRHPLYNWPLDPACQFFKVSHTPSSQSLVSGLMDPAMHSGTQALMSQSQTLGDHPATLSLIGGTDALLGGTADTLLSTVALPTTTTSTSLIGSSTSLLNTQMPPDAEGTLALSGTGTPSSLEDLQIHPLSMSQWTSPRPPSSRFTKTRSKSRNSLSPVSRLRRRFKFHRTSPVIAGTPAASERPASQAEDRTRDFFKQRAIAKQRAEYAAAEASAGSLFASDRLAGGAGVVERVRTHCSRRYRVGSLPDVQSLTPETFLQPLFALLTADACGVAPRLNTLILVAALESLGSEQSAFVAQLAAHMSRLLQLATCMVDQREMAARALVATSFALVWELHRRALQQQTESVPDVLTALPMPQDIVEAALATGQTEAAICLLEEVLCAAAAKRRISPQFSDSSGWLSPWTAGSLKNCDWILCPYSLPDELLPLACADQSQQSTLNIVDVWWQLARLYRFAGRSSELMGWLVDRWASIHPVGSEGPSALRCVGSALLAMRRLDYEKAFSEFSELVAAYNVDEEDEEETDDNETTGPSGIWASCPDSVSAELQLICREELLRCLEEMGSWQKLDELASSTASALLDSAPPVHEASSAVTATSKDSLAPLWSNAYAADSVMPLILRARLHLAVQAEIEVHCGITSVGQERLQRLKDLFQSRLSTVDMGAYFESKYPYELALLSVLENNWSKAVSFCESAFKQLSQAWTTKSSEGYRENLERSQLLTELEEFVRPMSQHPPTEINFSALLLKWRKRCVEESLEGMASSEEVLTNRLLFLSKASTVRTVAHADSLLPACFDFRLASAKACIRANSIRRALDRLSPLHKLAKALDESTDYLITPQCCRLAWCNAFASCWSAAYDLDGLANRCVVELSADSRQSHIEKGLAQGLSALSQCIDFYSQLGEAISFHPTLSILQFSHSVEFGRLLARFAQLLSANRLSADGSTKLDSLLPNLEARSTRVDGLFELQLGTEASHRTNRVNSLAFVFLRRAACLAHGVYDEISLLKANPISIASRTGEARVDEELRMSRVLFSTPAEALIELADFSDAQMSVIDSDTTGLEGGSSIPSARLPLAHAFIYSVLTAMYLGADGGRLRFARALQVTGRLGAYVDVEPDVCDACLSQHSIDSRHLTQTFRSLVQRIPSWMFLQWLDNLMSALFQESPLQVLLAEAPLLQLCKLYPQTVFYFFRVAVTAALHAAEKTCGPGLKGSSAVERLITHLESDQSSNSCSRILISKLAHQLSNLRALDRFLSELEMFSEPDLIFRDWATSEARNVLRTSQPLSDARERLVESFNRLTDNHFTSLPPGSFMQTDQSVDAAYNSESTLRERKVKKLLECLRVELGPGGDKLRTLTPAELSDCLRRVDVAFASPAAGDNSSSTDLSAGQQSRPSLADYSPWLASFGETLDLSNTPLEMPGHFLTHLRRPDREKVVFIHRLHPSVKPLVSLRKPKVLRILGSNGVWSNWLVKSGEDLRQDSRIQHLFHFANHALAHASTSKHPPIASASDAAADNEACTLSLRTYLVLPVTSQLGLLRWIPDTTTVADFCKSAMRAAELARYK
ncbi:hypothetical protein AAHC03_017166 [Spirometra sp. Aus1]